MVKFKQQYQHTHIHAHTHTHTHTHTISHDKRKNEIIMYLGKKNEIENPRTTKEHILRF